MNQSKFTSTVHAPLTRDASIAIISFPATCAHDLRDARTIRDIATNNRKIGRALFPERVPQFLLRRFHFTFRLIAKQNRAQLIALIIASDKLFLRISAAKINSRGLHAEISDKVKP